MREQDSGATLIEVIMGIVLLSLLVPAVYFLVGTISRGLHRGVEQDRVYQVTQMAVEQAKATGPEGVQAQLAGALPEGYTVEVKKETSGVDGLNLDAYRVEVKWRGVNRLDYTYYWTGDA